MHAARRALWIAAFVGVLVAGWRFAAVHPQPVRIDYLLGETGDMPLWLALLGAAAAGGLLVGGAAAYQLARLGMLARRYRKAVGRLELQLHELRNLPLEASAPPLDETGPLGPGGPALPRGG